MTCEYCKKETEEDFYSVIPPHKKDGIYFQICASCVENHFGMNLARCICFCKVCGETNFCELVQIPEFEEKSVYVCESCIEGEMERGHKVVYVSIHHDKKKEKL